MKKHLFYVLLAGLASVLLARAQTTPAPAQPVDNTNATVTGSPMTNTVAPMAPAEAAPATNTAVAPAAVTESTPTNAPVEPAVTATTSAAPPVAAAATNAPATPVGAPETIPLIQFSDVPITTAIEHLARQAGINYMLDPKIGYGQPDQNGQIKPEPQLSIRWENITAESALMALLDNYGLQLVVDKKTGIDRITLKDPTAPPPLITRVVQLQYASVSNITVAVQSVFTDKRSKVWPMCAPASCCVVATDPEQQSVDTLVAQLDKPTRQVLIETKLIEISSPHRHAWRGLEFDLEPTERSPLAMATFRARTPSPRPARCLHDGQDPRWRHILHARLGPPLPAFPGSLDQTIGGGGWSASTLAGLIPATGFLNADGVIGGHLVPECLL